MASIYEENDWYELQEDNEQIARDEAWEEYMSTGIDPTGGELGPDFDPASGRFLSEMEEPQELQKTASTRSKPKPNANPPQQPFSWRALFWIAVVVFFGICIISGLEKKSQEKARIEQQARDREWEERQTELRRQRELEDRMNEHVKTPEEIEAEKQATREEVQRLLNSGRGLYGQGVTPSRATGPIKPAKSGLPQRGTAFGDGYWDGYDEGFDDADGHNQYGFKYDETTNKYSGRALSDYVRGYRKGYKEGWNEGIEQLQDRYDNGDDELDEEEY